MARNKSIQVACAPDLYAKIVAYRNEKNISSDADAMRELTLFALRILEHKDDAEGLSTRELLEVILTYTVKAQHTSSRVYYQTFVDTLMDTDSAKMIHRGIMSAADDKVAQILAGDVN